MLVIAISMQPSTTVHRRQRKAGAGGQQHSLSLSLVSTEMEEAMVIDRFRLGSVTQLNLIHAMTHASQALQIPGLGERENPFNPCFLSGARRCIDKLGFKGDQRHSVLKPSTSAAKAARCRLHRVEHDLEGKACRRKRRIQATGFRNT